MIDTIMNKSMHSEDVRLKEIAKYKQMAIDYKLQIEKEMKEAAILKKKEDDQMNARIQLAMERGREKEILKLKAYQEKRMEDRKRAAEKLLLKQKRAQQEDNLLAMLRKGGASKIKLGKGIQGLSRHWKKMNKQDRNLFSSIGGASEKLGLSPLRIRKGKEKEKEKEKEKKEGEDDDEVVETVVDSIVKNEQANK